jgi:hypothetical protein
VIYSKSQVDRAGQTLADALRLVVDGKATAIERSPELLRAIEIIDWWRGEHARPLSRVAANLRYYAGEHEAPRVAQRLKKFRNCSGRAASGAYPAAVGGE